jgi:hypothetical protein
MERIGAALLERPLGPVDIVFSAATAVCIWTTEHWSPVLNSTTRQDEHDALLAMVCCSGSAQGLQAGLSGQTSKTTGTANDFDTVARVQMRISCAADSCNCLGFSLPHSIMTSRELMQRTMLHTYAVDWAVRGNFRGVQHLRDHRGGPGSEPGSHHRPPEHSACSLCLCWHVSSTVANQQPRRRCQVHCTGAQPHPEVGIVVACQFTHDHSAMTQLIDEHRQRTQLYALVLSACLTCSWRMECVMHSMRSLSQTRSHHRNASYLSFLA